MSNMGLEIALKQENIPFLRSDVGDRYILEMLRQKGGNIGGETSGHMICMDYAETGDGLITALQILEIMTRTNKTLSELTKNLKKYPQITENVTIKSNFDVMKSKDIALVVSEVEAKLMGCGRVILRPSGTEPVLRITVEGEDYNLIVKLTKQLVDKVKLIIR
jgi:phosphoglucosamine mutase